MQNWLRSAVSLNYDTIYTYIGRDTNVSEGYALCICSIEDNSGERGIRILRDKEAYTPD